MKSIAMKRNNTKRRTRKDSDGNSAFYFSTLEFERKSTKSRQRPNHLPILEERPQQTLPLPTCARNANIPLEFNGEASRKMGRTLSSSVRFKNPSYLEKNEQRFESSNQTNRLNHLKKDTLSNLTNSTDDLSPSTLGDSFRNPNNFEDSYSIQDERNNGNLEANISSQNTNEEIIQSQI